LNLSKEIFSTLAYFEIFKYPLSEAELYTFLQHNTISFDEFSKQARIVSAEPDSLFCKQDGYYMIKPADGKVDARLQKEKHAGKFWKIARFMTALIARFPFVRAVMITGSLSKNCADSNSDLDFMVICAKNRLWISKSLLMLFKKLFLFNSYKYFCINYFIAEDCLEITDRNIFTATELATVKIAYNTELVMKFINANSWVRNYLPNYKSGDPLCHSPAFSPAEKQSYLQRFLEKLFPQALAEKLNIKLMKVYIDHYRRKYCNLPDEEFNDMFNFSVGISRTHPGNMQKKILDMYNLILDNYNIK